MTKLGLGILAFITIVSCKFQNKNSSDVQSIEDGGCDEILQELESLQRQIDAYENDYGKDPNTYAGYSLTEASPAPSAASAVDDALDDGVDPFATPAETSVDNSIETAAPIETVDGTDLNSWGIGDNTVNNNSNSSSSISSSGNSNEGAVQQGPFADLERQIAKKQEELQKCYDAKFGQTEIVAPKNGRQSHCDFKDQPYEILSYNCHSAANEAVIDEPKKTGIVSCGGDAPVNGSPEHHTFNYRVEGNQVVYYNWGQTCKAPLKGLPPNIHDPDHLPCADTFCGQQFDAQNTKALPIGQKVEEPGPLYCSQKETSRAACDTCCQTRGKYWDLAPDPLRPNDRTFVQFMSQCYSSCASTFPR